MAKETRTPRIPNSISAGHPSGTSEAVGVQFDDRRFPEYAESILARRHAEREGLAIPTERVYVWPGHSKDEHSLVRLETLKAHYDTTPMFFGR